MSSWRVRLSEQCGTVRCEPGWSWTPRYRRISDFDLWYVWAGAGEMRNGTDVFDLRPGTLLCLRPGDEYGASHDPRNRLGVSYLHFDFAGRRGRKLIGELPPVICKMAEMDWIEQIMRRAVQLRQSLSPANVEQAERLVESVLLSMRTQAQATSLPALEQQHRAVIATIVRHIRENPGDMVSVTDLAARAGYSVDHFTRLFETHVGKSPKAFCINVRIERAALLLRESAMSVEAVARDLGYADVYFFSRQFKQRTGISPTAWRKHAMAKSE